MEGLYENRKEEEEFTKAYIQNMYQFFGYGIWAVCLKENDRVIGRAGLSNREVDGKNELELGYVIELSEQNKGYAYEACSSILAFAKDQLCAEQVVAFIQTANKSSCSLIQKLGFQYIKNVVMTDESDKTDKTFAYYIKIL